LTTPYTGVPANATDAIPTISVPADGDAPAAATFTPSLEALCDFAAKLWADWQPNVGSAARVKIKTISNNQTGRKTRFFVKADGTLEVTFGCDWDQANTRWTADNGVLLAGRVFDVSRLRLGIGVGLWNGVLVDRPVSTNAYWPDTAWESACLNGAQLAFLGTQADIAGTNPPNTEAQVNTLCAKNTCKAWGSVSIMSGTPTLIGGFNVTSVAVVGFAVVVTFAVVMADDHYALDVTSEPLTGSIGLYPSRSRSQDSFSITFEKCDGSGAFIGNMQFDFFVFGRQDS
jgi:hypothetical protein